MDDVLHHKPIYEKIPQNPKILAPKIAGVIHNIPTSCEQPVEKLTSNLTNVQ